MLHVLYMYTWYACNYGVFPHVDDKSGLVVAKIFSTRHGLVDRTRGSYVPQQAITVNPLGGPVENSQERKKQ